MKRKNPKSPTSQTDGPVIQKPLPAEAARPPQQWVSLSMIVLDKPEPIPPALKKRR